MRRREEPIEEHKMKKKTETRNRIGSREQS